MYLQLYELINHYVFNDIAASAANTDLICTALASIGVIMVVAIPFFIVYKVITIIMGL